MFKQFKKSTIQNLNSSNLSINNTKRNAFIKTDANGQLFHDETVYLSTLPTGNIQYTTKQPIYTTVPIFTIDQIGYSVRVNNTTTLTLANNLLYTLGTMTLPKEGVWMCECSILLGSNTGGAFSGNCGFSTSSSSFNLTGGASQCNIKYYTINASSTATFPMNNTCLINTGLYGTRVFYPLYQGSISSSVIVNKAGATNSFFQYTRIA